MNNLIKILIITVVLQSCTKLVEVKPKGFVNPSKAEDLRLLLNNTAGHRAYMPITMGYRLVKFAAAQNAYQKDYTFESESAASYYMRDQAVITSRNYGDIIALSKVNAIANTVLDILPKTSDLSKEERNQIKGEALVHRAYNFLTLVNIHAVHYDEKTASQDQGIVLLLSSDFNDPIPEMSSVQEVYSLILDDLNEAKNLLTDLSKNKSFPSSASAYGLLARTHLYMGDYKQALENANEAIKINGFVYDAFSPEARYREYPTSKELLLFKAESSRSYDQQQRLVGKGFMSLFEENDVRKYSYSQIDEDTYQYNTSAFHLSGVSVAEMYFIRAECYARIGGSSDLALALKDLNYIRKNRIRSSFFVELKSSNQDEVMNFVLRERKLELAWKGLRWFDMKRLNKEIKYQTTIRRSYKGKTLVLKPGDAEWAFPYPQSIIE
jgi:tetratricopeptide (TPR) repeat protein